MGHAEVAKLVDAPGSELGGNFPMGVQISPSAHKYNAREEELKKIKAKKVA